MCASDLDIFFYVCSHFRVAIRMHKSIYSNFGGVSRVESIAYIHVYVRICVYIHRMPTVCRHLRAQPFMCIHAMCVFTLVSDIRIQLQCTSFTLISQQSLLRVDICMCGIYVQTFVCSR